MKVQETEKEKEKEKEKGKRKSSSTRPRRRRRSAAPSARSRPRRRHPSCRRWRVCARRARSRGVVRVRIWVSGAVGVGGAVRVCLKER